MATTQIGTMNSRSSALTGGVVDSTLVHTPLPDNYLGFQRGDKAPVVALLGKEGPQKVTNIARYWLWSNSTPITDTLSVSVDASQTTWTVAHPEYYQIGAHIFLDTEAVEVTGRGSGTVTVRRGAEGTTPAGHTNGATIFVGVPTTAEGSDTTNIPFTQGDKDYNVYHDIEMAWPITHRAKTVVTEEFPSGGLFSDMFQRVTNREIPRRLEMALFKQRRSAGSGVEGSTFGGFAEPTFITTRVPGVGVLNETHINTTLQTLFNLDVEKLPPIVMGQPLMGRILSSFYAGSRWIGGDATSVTNYLDRFKTPFGDIQFLPNHLMASVAPDALLFFDPADIKQSPYDSKSNWQTGMYETQGQYERQFVFGDISYTFPYCDSRAMLTGITTTEASYSGLA